MNEAWHSPEMTVALALAAGIIAQSLARHLRVPGIVLLLLSGVVLGPDMANVIHPDRLGSALLTLVGFAVAIILFEGGLNLDLKRLRREQRAIRQLVLLGALVTMLGATLAAKLFMGWPWRMSILFGTLVIVTGPTVITPLLRRLKLEHKTATVLEAEGVLIDAVGAVVATVALEVALSPSGRSLAAGGLHIVASLGAGAAIGLVGGLVIAYLLRVRNLVPEGLENVFTLSLVLALFQVSNAVMAESGIAAATLAGVVVGNVESHAVRELREFKEQLTLMFIGMLFVLLAADVRVAEVQALGVPALLTVAALMLVVRPLNVLAGTWGTDLSRRQKLFMAWIGPRGIVAAAIAAFFAAELEKNGIEGGSELRALVFLVIVVTVLWASLTGGLVARLLGLRRAADSGWVILGANELALSLAKVLGNSGQEVVCIDTNPDACSAAERAGFRVVYGNALQEHVLHRAEIDTRRGAIALATSTEVNLLFMKRAKEEGKLKTILVSLGRARAKTSLAIVHGAAARVLFGRPEHLDMWAVRVRRDIAHPQRWLAREAMTPARDASVLGEAPEGLFLAMARTRGKRTDPVDDQTRFKKGDEVSFLVNRERDEAVTEWLTSRGWERQDEQDQQDHG